MNYLDERNRIYNFQYKFSDCRNVKQLSFDFYLPANNLCIEYDGEQHFSANNFIHKNDQNRFDEQKHRDQIKTEYCIKNNINLLRIPYTDLKNIPKILSDYFKINVPSIQ